MDPIEEEEAIANERASERPTVDADLLDEAIATLCGGEAVSMPADGSVGDAIRAMQERRIGSVLVVDGTRLVGIVTERDVLMKVAGKEVSALEGPVEGIMTRAPETLRAEDSLIFLMNKMHVGGFRHVPIVDEEGTPQHVISLRAVLGHLIDQFGSRVVNIPPDPYRGERREGSG